MAYFKAFLHIKQKLSFQTTLQIKYKLSFQTFLHIKQKLSFQTTLQIKYKLSFKTTLQVKQKSSQEALRLDTRSFPWQQETKGFRKKSGLNYRVHAVFGRQN